LPAGDDELMKKMLAERARWALCADYG